MRELLVHNPRLCDQGNDNGSIIDALKLAGKDKRELGTEGLGVGLIAAALVDAGRFNGDVPAFIHAGGAFSNNKAAAASSRGGSFVPTTAKQRSLCSASKGAHRPPGWLIAQT
jgi:hypothetical protein